MIVVASWVMPMRRTAHIIQSALVRLSVTGAPFGNLIRRSFDDCNRNASAKEFVCISEKILMRVRASVIAASACQDVYRVLLAS